MVCQPRTISRAVRVWHVLLVHLDLDPTICVQSRNFSGPGPALRLSLRLTQVLVRKQSLPITQWSHSFFVLSFYGLLQFFFLLFWFLSGMSFFFFFFLGGGGGGGGGVDRACSLSVWTLLHVGTNAFRPARPWYNCKYECKNNDYNVIERAIELERDRDRGREREYKLVEPLMEIHSKPTPDSFEQWNCTAKK